MANKNDIQISTITNPYDLAEPIKNNVAANIQNLLKQHKMTKKALAQAVGMAESSINDYCNLKKSTVPPLSVLVAMRNLYDIDINEFLTKTINIDDYNRTPEPSKTDIILEEAHRKYTGTYVVYYLDTSSYKGRDDNNSKDSLTYGVLTVFESKSNVAKSTFDVYAVMGISDRETAYELKSVLEVMDDSVNDVIALITERGLNEKLYTGDFCIEGDFAYISIVHKNNDRALAILHSPSTNKGKYIGGLGTINSVSKGREKMPTVQFIALSRKALRQSDDDIHRNLLMAYPTLSAASYAPELVQTFTNLYVDKASDESNLSNFQKNTTMQANIEMYMLDSIERNMFRYGKISNQDDDYFYHWLKETDIDDVDDDLK